MSTLTDLQPTTTAPAQDLAPDRMPGLPAVPTHQTLAIVCALVFFRPLGTAAVVSAGHVRTFLALGDLESARRASRRTLWLCCASAAVTLFFVLVIALCAGGYSRVH